MNETSNVQATGTPNSVAAIATPKAKPERKRKPVANPGLALTRLGDVVPDAAKGAIIIRKGEELRDRDGNIRHNKLGATMVSKSLIIKAPTGSDIQRDGEKLVEATARANAIGRAIKPAIMGRIAAAGADNAFMVRRYTETPGKRDRIGLTLERVNVENMAIKFAREYGLKLEEVYRKFPQLKPNKDKAINVTEV